MYTYIHNYNDNNKNEGFSRLSYRLSHSYFKVFKSHYRSNICVQSVARLLQRKMLCPRLFFNMSIVFPGEILQSK